MNLSHFISTTVLEIIKGIKDGSKLSGKKVGLYSTGNVNQRHIEFDVAVTAEGVNKKSGGVGIRVLELIQVGGKKEIEAKNATVSRIKFGVRINEQKSN